jgi:hypothetical protein
MAVFELSQRDLEGILEDIDPVYRHIEDCEDSDTLRGYAQTLLNAARRLENLGGQYMDDADNADAEEEEGDGDFLDGNCDPEMAAFMVAQGEVCGTCGHNLCPDCGECEHCGDCECEKEEECPCGDPFCTGCNQ